MQYVLLGIYAALLVIQTLLNMFGPSLIALFNWISVAWHMLGVVMICILVPALVPVRPSAEWVFTTFRKPDVGIDSSVYIFLLGLLMSQFCLTGVPAHDHCDSNFCPLVISLLISISVPL
jgi:amino acid transporter